MLGISYNDKRWVDKGKQDDSFCLYKRDTAIAKEVYPNETKK